MRKINFHQGQSLIGIIIVLVVVGLITAGSYCYFSKQIPGIPQIAKKMVAEIKQKELEKIEIKMDKLPKVIHGIKKWF